MASSLYYLLMKKPLVIYSKISTKTLVYFALVVWCLKMCVVSKKMKGLT